MKIRAFVTLFTNQRLNGGDKKHIYTNRNKDSDRDLNILTTAALHAAVVKINSNGANVK